MNIIQSHSKFLSFYLFILMGLAPSFTNTIFGEEILEINGNIDSSKTITGKNVIVTIDLTNTENLPIEQLNIQLLSPGFKIINEKAWPVKLYPDSTIKGMYVLEAINSGNHVVSISSSYIVNATDGNIVKIIQESKSKDIGTIQVQQDLTPSFSTFWTGAASTSLGILAGLLIPKFIQKINEKSSLESERKKDIKKIKSLILQDIKLNEIRIQSSLPPSLSINDKINNEGTYYLVAEDKVREDQYQNFYAKLTEYSRKTNAERGELVKTELLELAASFRKIIQGWTV